MDKRPKVGLGVIIVKNGQVLFGQRLGAHGEGTWCPPGGHLEFGESFEECAKREVKEEAGLDVDNLAFITATNDVHINEGKHYVTIYMQAQYSGGEPKIMEPDKMVKWAWFDWDKLPEPLFLPIQNLIKTGYNPL